MTRGRGIVFLTVFLVLAVFFTPGEGQEKKKGAKGGEPKKSTKGPAGGFGITASRAPVDITSDTVEMDQKKNMATFKGNVIAKQEDISIHCNTLTVHYDPETKKIKEIVAGGNVKIVQQERRATSQKAIFLQDENKIVLEGDAVVREGDNVIRGERVIHFIDEERSIVEGEKGGRVMTTITPSGKDLGETRKTKGESKP